MAKLIKTLSVAWMLISSLASVRAQNAQQVIQQVVDTERTADKNDHSNWTYLEEVRKPKEHVVQWVASTQKGNVERVVRKNDADLPATKQRDDVQNFLRDQRAQSKQIAESNHDNQQVDDLLKLLPEAFQWTQTGSSKKTTTLHFDPLPGYRPPTREARVFGGMSGDLVADNRQHRIVSMRGHLIHDVNFGGGLLGKLREGSSFSLNQAEVKPGYWQLTQIHVHLAGNALLFKSISLEQDDERSRFVPEADTISLSEAAELALKQPTDVLQQQTSLH